MKYNTSDFVNKATLIHSGKYGYTNTVYVNAKTNVTITCKIHGDFEQIPSNHTHVSKPQGCPKCALEAKTARLVECNSARKGTSTMKPLQAEWFTASVIEDLGMRVLPSGRPMRHVKLACTECGDGFVITVDNAKRRQEHLCNTCKINKVTCVCKACGAEHKHMHSTLVGNPGLHRLCRECDVKEKAIVTTVKSEGFTPANILKYLYIEDGIIYKRLTKEPIDIAQIRPRIYTEKVYYVQVAYTLHTGIADNTVARNDSTKTYTLDNILTGVAYGGFDRREPGILYYLKINNGQAYKIGITNKTVSKRFALSDLPKIEVVAIRYYEVGEDAYAAEKSVLKGYKEYKYIGEPLLTSGNTELFTIDVLGIDTKDRKGVIEVW
jgi:hypothetical protein